MAEFDITAEITAVLKEYTGEVMDGVDKAVVKCGNGMRKDIQEGSPKRRPQYFKGWRSKFTTHTQGYSRGNKSVKVYNETDYQLTHLLEKRHKKRGGKGYVEPQPHIAPAEEKWNEEFYRMCEGACKPK